MVLRDFCKTNGKVQSQIIFLIRIQRTRSIHDDEPETVSSSCSRGNFSPSDKLTVVESGKKSVCPTGGVTKSSYDCERSGRRRLWRVSCAISLIQSTSIHYGKVVEKNYLENNKEDII